MVYYNSNTDGGKLRFSDYSAFYRAYTDRFKVPPSKTCQPDSPLIPDEYHSPG